MVLYQDGLLSSGNKWHYYVYDNINRIVEESIVASSLSQAEIQSIYYNNSFNNTYPYIGGQSDYRKPLSGSSFSLEEHLFSARYGDYPYLTSYSGGVTSEFSIPSDLSFLPISGVVSQSDIDSRVSNLKLYEKLAILGGGGTFVERAYYYDYLGRVVQKVERNHLGGISRTSVKYDFTGNILQVNESHQKSPGGVSEVKNSLYAYDEHGRVVSENSNLLGGASSTVLYEYNEIGKLSKRSFGNGASETMTYNVQGWQQSNITKSATNNNIYTQTLYYYNPSLSQSTASYSGNVSEWGWMQGTNTTNRYSFLYDASSRLLSSTRYNHIGTAYNSFTERDISYDKNGNITALKRYGTSNSSPTDNFTYSYNGNILSTLYNSTGSLSSTYSYDLNGNLSFDGRKNLHFEYNILNLADNITSSGVMRASYTYLSDGTKLSVTDANGTGYDYLGSLTYSKSGNLRTLESTDFSRGRIVKSGNSTTPYYYIADHLGSTRVILDNSQNVLWRSDYYPYGTLHNSGNSYPITIPNRYTFSGKEEQTTGTLALLDFGARLYDRTLCRWMTQDPLSSKYPGISQYVYCINNPVRFIDLDGMDPIYAKNFWGKIRQIGDDGQNSTGSYLVRGSVARDVKNATKAGEFYTGSLAENENVMYIPTGQIQQDVQQTATATINSGTSPETRVENGGHSLKGDKVARIWDAGSTMETQILPDGSIEQRWSVKPFKIGGKNNQIGGSVNDIHFFWHTHPNGSTPSIGDTWWVGELRKYGFSGNSFLIDVNNNKVTFFNEKGSIMNINYDDFIRMGKQEKIK